MGTTFYKIEESQDPMDFKFNLELNITSIATFCLGAIIMYFFRNCDKVIRRGPRRKKAIPIRPKVQFEIPPTAASETTISSKDSKDIAPKSKVIKTKKEKVRIYLDGCWDVLHSGHYNAFRQAKGLGDTLVVGVHSDQEIALHKREPVMKNEQRMAA